jgi:hypothetical protein
MAKPPRAIGWRSLLVFGVAISVALAANEVCADDKKSHLLLRDQFGSPPLRAPHHNFRRSVRCRNNRRRGQCRNFRHPIRRHNPKYHEGRNSRRNSRSRRSRDRADRNSRHHSRSHRSRDRAGRNSRHHGRHRKWGRCSIPAR